MGRQLEDALRKALGGRERKVQQEPGKAKAKGPLTLSRRPVVKAAVGKKPASDSVRIAPARKPKAGAVHRSVVPECEAVRARITGEFVPHELFRPSGRAMFERLRPRYDGIEPQIAKRPTNAADLILGLDFGTSTVKAVIRDHTSGQSFSVPFADKGRNPFLLPTRVFCSPAGYSLDAGHVRIEDLKMRLIRCSAKLPVEEFNDACAFLALVMRHCRGWLLDRYESLYRNHQLTWSVNLGMPARTYEDEGRVRLFRRLAWAAANLAADGKCRQVKEEEVTLFRQLSLEAYRHGEPEEKLGGFEILPRDVDVVPEIAAQVFGFVQSTHWDPLRHSRFLLIDVGAGTVDTAFFAIVRKTDRAVNFVFYSAEVSPLGVNNLHGARIAWMREALRAGGIRDKSIDDFLHRIRNLPGDFPLVPDRVVDYAAGLEYVVPRGSRTVDEEFFHRELVPQVGDCFTQGKMEQKFLWKDLDSTPIFVCGGGARMELYRQIPEGLNQKLRGSGSVVATPLPVPEKFTAPGLERVEYDRLSVAYGLSWQGAGGRKLGEIIRREDIRPPLVSDRASFTDRYISKDQV